MLYGNEYYEKCFFVSYTYENTFLELVSFFTEKDGEMILLGSLAPSQYDLIPLLLAKPKNEDAC